MQETILLWHVTTRKALPSILKEGLVPAKGARATKLGEPHARIFCFTSGTALKDALTNWLGEELEEQDLVVLEIESSLSEMKNAESIGWEVALTKPVAPSRIRVLIDDVDLWQGQYPATAIPCGWS